MTGGSVECCLCLSVAFMFFVDLHQLDNHVLDRIALSCLLLEGPKCLTSFFVIFLDRDLV